MSKQAEVAQHPTRVSLVQKIAAKYSVDPDKMLATLKATAFRQRPKKDGSIIEVSNEQMMALLVVADAHNLNPFTREIYAFPDERGGIVPIVSIDGWVRIINERPELIGIEFETHDDSDDQWISCTISRKDRVVPITVREYFKECYRDTGPWNSHPRRMLRHKVLIQCARVAFGFGGIYDPDEAERISEAMAVDSTATEVRTKPKTAAPKAIEAPKAEETVIPAVDLAVGLLAAMDRVGVSEKEVLKHLGIASLSEATPERLTEGLKWVISIGDQDAEIRG
jgi:phage recombination protein Bet